MNRNATVVKGAKVLDRNSLEISIDSPKPYFLAKMIHPTAFVLDSRTIMSDEDNWTKTPNGTGPFRLAEYLEGEILVLKRNDHYHLGPAYLDQVEFLLQGGDPLTMYKNNEIHMTGVSLRTIQEIEDPSSPLHKELHWATPAAMTSFLAMNTQMPPLDDPGIRMAIRSAIDKEKLETTVYKGFARQADTIIPPGFPSYNLDSPKHEYDRHLAANLLRESSYGQQGQPIPPIILTLAGELGRSIPLDIEIMLEEWEAIGLEIHVQQTPFDSFLVLQRQLV